MRNKITLSILSTLGFINKIHNTSSLSPNRQLNLVLPIVRDNYKPELSRALVFQATKKIYEKVPEQARILIENYENALYHESFIEGKKKKNDYNIQAIESLDSIISKILESDNPKIAKFKKFASNSNPIIRRAIISRAILNGHLNCLELDAFIRKYTEDDRISNNRIITIMNSLNVNSISNIELKKYNADLDNYYRNNLDSALIQAMTNDPTLIKNDLVKFARINDLELYNKVFQAEKAFDNYRASKIIKNHKKILMDLIFAMRKDRRNVRYITSDTLTYLQESADSTYPWTQDTYHIVRDIVEEIYNFNEYNFNDYNDIVDRHIREYRYNNDTSKEKMLIIDDFISVIERLSSDTMNYEINQLKTKISLEKNIQIQKLIEKGFLCLHDSTISEEIKRLIRKYKDCDDSLFYVSSSILK